MIHELYKIESLCFGMIKRFGFKDKFYTYLTDIVYENEIPTKYVFYLESNDKTKYLEVTIPIKLTKKYIKVKTVKNKLMFRRF